MGMECGNDEVAVCCTRGSSHDLFLFCMSVFVSGAPAPRPAISLCPAWAVPYAAGEGRNEASTKQYLSTARAVEEGRDPDWPTTPLCLRALDSFLFDFSPPVPLFDNDQTIN